jgi:hypothetical protein
VEVMNISKDYRKSRIRYKGQVFVIIEVDFEGKLPGIRNKKKSVNRVLLNANLSGRKKQLEFHRLLTGRGLRDLETHRPVKFS